MSAPPPRRPNRYAPPSHGAPSLAALSQHDDDDAAYADDDGQFERPSSSATATAAAAAAARRYNHASSNGPRQHNATSSVNAAPPPFVSSTLSGSPLERSSDGMRTMQSAAHMQQQNDALSHAYATMQPDDDNAAAYSGSDVPASAAPDFLAEHAAARSSKLSALNLQTHMSESMIARVARAAAVHASKQHTGAPAQDLPLHSLLELDLSRPGPAGGGLSQQKIKTLSALDCVPRLTKLVLNHQLLESLHPGLQPLFHLRVLSVEHNQLARIEGLWHLAHSLEELHLGHNAIERLPKRMGELKRLIILRLHANRLSEIGSTLAALGGCSNLTSLTLFANPLAEIASMRSQVLAALPALETLDAQGIDADERAEARERFGAMDSGAAKEALLAAQQALSAVQRRNTDLESQLSASEKREHSLRRKLELAETELTRSSSLAAKLDRELNERIHTIQELQAQLAKTQQEFDFYRIDHEGGNHQPSPSPNGMLLRSPSSASVNASPQPSSSPQTDRRNAAEWNRTGSRPPSPSRTRFATPTSSPSKLTLDFGRGGGGGGSASPLMSSYPLAVVLPVSEELKADRAEIQMLDLLLTAAETSLDRRAQRVAAKRADARALQAQHAKVRSQMEAFSAGSGDAANLAASPARRPSLLSSPAASTALDAECVELQHQIDSLSAELTGLNTALQSASSSSERAEIQQARADVEESLDAARSDLLTKQRQGQGRGRHDQQQESTDTQSHLDRAAMGSVSDDLDDLDGSQSFRAASLSTQLAQLPELLVKLEAAEKALHADVASDSSRVIALNKRASTWSIRREYLTNQLAGQKTEWMKQREALAAPLPSDHAARQALLESFAAEFDAQTLADPDALANATLVPQMLQLEESLCAAEIELERAHGELELAKTQMAATRNQGTAAGSMRSPTRGPAAANAATASGSYHFSPRIDSTGGLHLLEQNELLTALSSLQLDNTELRAALDKSVDSIEALKRNKKELKDALRALERSTQSTPIPQSSPVFAPTPQDAEKLARAEKRIDSLLGELTALKGEYARTQDEIASLQEELERAQNESRKALAQSASSAPKAASSSGATSPPNALATLQSMVDDYERDIPLLQGEKERLAAELADSENQVRELQKAAAAASAARGVPLEEKERLLAELEQSENRVRELQAQRGVPPAEKERLLAELAQSERMAEALQREKDTLRDQLREAHRVAEAAAATAALAAQDQPPPPPRTPSPPPSVRDSPSVQAQADSARVAELESMFSVERRRALAELETMAAQLKAKETEAQRAAEAASRSREQQEAHEAILRQREALAAQQQQLHEQQQRTYELAQAQLAKQQQEMAAMEARQAQQLASQRELSAQQHSELQAQQLAQRDLLSTAVADLTSRFSELQARERELQDLLDSKVVEIADLESLLQSKQRDVERAEAAMAAAKAAGDKAVQEAAQKVANLNADAASISARAPPSVVASASASAKASPPTSNPASARSAKHAPNVASAASKSAVASPVSALSPALSVSSAHPPSELQALALADPALHTLEAEIAAQTLVLQNLQDAVAQTQTELDTRRRIGAEIAAMEKALAESVEEEKQRARALLSEETSELLALRQSKFELDRGLDQSLADLSAITERHRALADQVTKLEMMRTQAKEEARSRRAIDATEKADRDRAAETSRQELSDLRAQLSGVRADLEALEKSRAAADANLASLRDQTSAARNQLDTLAGAHVSARAQVDSGSAALGSQVTDARRELNEVLGQLARALEQMAETSKDLADLSAQKRAQMLLWDERERDWRALQLSREQERTDHENLVRAMQDNIRKHEEHLSVLAKQITQRHRELENVSAAQQQQQQQQQLSQRRHATNEDDAANETEQQFTFAGASNPKRSGLAVDASADASLNYTIPDALGSFASPTKSRSINMREQQAKYSKPAPLSPAGAKPKGGAGGSSGLKGYREAFCATSAMEDGFVPPPAPVRNEEVHARAVEASAARAQARREAAEEEAAAKLASEAQEELHARRAKKRAPFSSTGGPPRGFSSTAGSPPAKRAAEADASRAAAPSEAECGALDAQVVQLQKQIRQLGGEKRALKSELRLFAEECAAARAFMAHELQADQAAIAESKAQVERAKSYVNELMPLVDVGRSQAVARLDARLENHDLSPEEREIQTHARIHAHQPPLDESPHSDALSGQTSTAAAGTPLDPRRAKATTEVDAVLLRTPSGRAATRSRESTQQRSQSIPASPSGSGAVGSGRSASLSPQPRVSATSAASSPDVISGSPGQRAELDSLEAHREREAVQALRQEKVLLKRAVKDLHKELGSALDSAQQEGLALQAHSTELRAACTEAESRLELLRAQVAAAEGAWRDMQDRVASMPGSMAAAAAPLSSTAVVASPRSNSTSSRSTSAQKSTTTTKRVSGKYYLDSPAKAATLPLSSPDGLKRKLHSPSRRAVVVEESKQNDDEADGRDETKSVPSDAATLTPLEISQLQQHNRELLRLHTELLGQLRLRGAVPRSNWTDLPSSIASLVSSAAPLNADSGPSSLLPKSAFLSLQDMFLMKEAHWSSSLASLREELVKRDQEQAALLRDLEARVHKDENSVAARLDSMEIHMRKIVEVVERDMHGSNSQRLLTAGGEPSSAFASPAQQTPLQRQTQSSSSAFSSPSQFARASASSLSAALNSDLLALFTQLRGLVASLAQSMHGFEVQLSTLQLHRSSRCSLGEAPMLNIDVSQAMREREGYILFLLENLREQGRISVAKLLPAMEPYWTPSLQMHQQSPAIGHLNAAGKVSLLEQVRREFQNEEAKHPSSGVGVPRLMSVSQSVSPAPAYSHSHQPPSSSTAPSVAAAPTSSPASAAAPLDIYAQMESARARPFAGLPPPGSSPAATAVSKTLSFDDAADHGDSSPPPRAAPVEIQPVDEFDAFATAADARSNRRLPTWSSGSAAVVPLAAATAAPPVRPAVVPFATASPDRPASESHGHSIVAPPLNLSSPDRDQQPRAQPQPSPLAMALARTNPAPLSSATPTAADPGTRSGDGAAAPHSAAAFRLR